jgi:uncharacterized protein YndB with AHSA1/START domain
MSTANAITARHATFVIERSYAATPSRVFAAWSDRGSKARWFTGPEEWKKGECELDFRVGGHERVSGGPKGGPVHTYEARYHDIVAERRIVSTYDMYMNDTRISVSLATVEFPPEGKGTLLRYTEQAVFFDDYDDAGSREHGTRALLDNLDRVLR